MSELTVLMTTEGTYPYGPGGVSTWCDALIRNTPDIRYTLLPLMMNPHIESRFEIPSNVREVITVPLWGIEEPAEFLQDIPFAQLYERKGRTTKATIEDEFLPLLGDFLDAMNASPPDSDLFGRTLVKMEEYFHIYDYNETFKSQPVWDAFKESMERFSRQMAARHRMPGAVYQLPSLFDLTESLRWLYRFLIILNARVPRTSVTHSTAAAFCGIPCITAKLRHGTPMVLTEHGVYLREQNLFLSRFRRLFFCKQFLLNLITTVVRANYYYADYVSPVCHYNTRWELAHGTPSDRIRVVHNGVDTEFFNATPKTHGRLHVVATARIDPLKDIETLLRVADRVREVHPTVLFTVYGAVADEAYYQRCLELVKELHLESTVSLGVATDDVVNAYQSADVVILTSISEAFPYSVLEAMSCARPVVASDVGGVHEVLQGCGILVKPRDDEGFAEAVSKLLSDRALRQHLGTQARERIRQNFRLEQSIAGYVDLYRELAFRWAAA